MAQRLCVSQILLFQTIIFCCNTRLLGQQLSSSSSSSNLSSNLNSTNLFQVSIVDLTTSPPLAVVTSSSVSNKNSSSSTTLPSSPTTVVVISTRATVVSVDKNSTVAASQTTNVSVPITEATEGTTITDNHHQVMPRPFLNSSSTSLPETEQVQNKSSEDKVVELLDILPKKGNITKLRATDSNPKELLESEDDNEKRVLRVILVKSNCETRDNNELVGNEDTNSPGAVISFKQVLLLPALFNLYFQK